jgi:poly(beta-D-mannuronate) lyase
MPTDNGGEDIRAGDSKTSFTRGFNVFEYNYFDDHRNEPEVISNKSCDNIYRFNTFNNCDGALVLRHGNRCLVYGNYINGKTGRGYSGGIRIIGEDHTVFNNYLENQEGAESEAMKAPVTLMAGIPSSPVSGYFAASRALVCFNTIVHATGPVFHEGVKNHTDNPVAPHDITLLQNAVIEPQGKNAIPFVAEDPGSIALSRDNVYTGGKSINQKGWREAAGTDFIQKNGYWYTKAPAEKEALEGVRKRIAPFQLVLSDEAISVFNPAWIMQRKDVGVSWIQP